MKKLVFTFMALLFLAGITLAADLPKTYVVGSPAVEEPSFVVNSADRTVVISLPLTQGQQTTDKAFEKITDPASVSVCLSQMYVKADGSAWVVVPEKDYCGSGTTAVVNGMITRTFKIPQIGDGVNYALRIWGQAGNKWLWINQSSPYSRLSQNGSPGYEVLIDLAKGTASPVPQTNPVRQ